MNNYILENKMMFLGTELKNSLQAKRSQKKHPRSVPFG
jgi:hypothetical protein